MRPTSVLKREAIFSNLESLALKNSYDVYKNKCFIDFFAGSGAFGLEAISRGASFSYFYDNNTSQILKINCELICKSNQYKIINDDLMNFQKIQVQHPISAIFIDPPYNLNPFDIILSKIIQNKILNQDSIMIIETHKNTSVNIPNELYLINKKIFGISKLLFIKI